MKIYTYSLWTDTIRYFVEWHIQQRIWLVFNNNTQSCSYFYVCWKVTFNILLLYYILLTNLNDSDVHTVNCKIIKQVILEHTTLLKCIFSSSNKTFWDFQHKLMSYLAHSKVWLRKQCHLSLIQPFNTSICAFTHFLMHYNNLTVCSHNFR